MSKSKLLYIHVGLSSFVNKDILILSKKFELDIFYFNLRKKTKLPWVFFTQFLFLIAKTKSSSAIVIQFAGYHSFLPTYLSKFFKKKSIIIMGGTDSVSFPSIKYGCFYKKYLRSFTKKSLKLADLLLPVADSLIDCEYTYQDNDYPRQGYLYHAPEITTKVQTIYNGYDENKWFFSSKKENNSFVTVASDLGTIFGKKLKGIDLINEVAPFFPRCKFYIIGGHKLDENFAENVILLNNIEHNDLPKFLSEKEFYLQLSISEGFPNALSEAMLSGCIPIVSNVGAMPFIVGEEGYVLKKKNAELLQDLIKMALESNKKEKSIQSRKRIIDFFPLAKRETELIESIEKIQLGI